MISKITLEAKSNHWQATIKGPDGSAVQRIYPPEDCTSSQHVTSFLGTVYPGAEIEVLA